jgi:hypothetical protein
MLILNMEYIFGIMVRRKIQYDISNTNYFSLQAAGDLIAREAGAYTCDPSGKLTFFYLNNSHFHHPGGPLNLLHRCILCSATKQLAEQISPLLTHVDFPDD